MPSTPTPPIFDPVTELEDIAAICAMVPPERRPAALAAIRRMIAPANAPTAPAQPAGANVFSDEKITAWREMYRFANCAEASAEESKARCDVLAMFEREILAQPCQTIRDLAFKLEVSGFCHDTLDSEFYAGTHTEIVAAEARRLITARDAPAPADAA